MYVYEYECIPPCANSLTKDCVHDYVIWGQINYR